MNLASIMDELGDALETIDGLRAHPFEADRVTPPAAIVSFPDSYDFDQTFSRGSDKVIFPVTIVVGRTDARTSRDRLAEYVAGNGAQSIKQVIEAHTPINYDSARVQSVEFGAVTIAATTYLAATFDIEIVAAGDTTT